MVSTRKKHYDKPPIPPPPPPPPPAPPPHFLQTLIGGFPPPQSLKAPLLNSLYRLLLDLCLRAEPYGVASDRFDVKFHKISFNIEFKEICDLSDILFRELHERFTQLFPALHDVSASQDHGQPGLYSQVFETAEEELTLVLRCCMVILNLLVSDPNLLLEKCKVLLSILRRIFSLNLTREKTGPKSWIESSDSCLPYLSTMLEVTI